MQNEHGGDDQRPDSGSPWSASGGGHDEAGAASAAAPGGVPGGGAPAGGMPGDGMQGSGMQGSGMRGSGLYGSGTNGGGMHGTGAEDATGPQDVISSDRPAPPAEGYGFAPPDQPGAPRPFFGTPPPGATQPFGGQQPFGGPQPGATQPFGTQPFGTQPYGAGAGQAPPGAAPHSAYGPAAAGFASAAGDPPGGYGPGGSYGPGYGAPGNPGAPGVPGNPGAPGGPAGPGGYGAGYGPPGGGYGSGGYVPPSGGYGMPGDFLQQPPPPRRRMSGLVAYIAVAAVAAAAGAGTVLLANHTNQQVQTPSSAPGLQQPNNGGGFPGGLGQNPGDSGPNPNISSATKQSVIRSVEPGLVNITSDLQYQAGTAAATGMVISKNGLVLTNNHVIEGTTQLTATVVTTGQRFSARFLGYNKSADVAVIQLEGATGLRTVPLGDSSKVKMGDGVVALGNAGGTGHTTTVTGAITGLNESITASDDGSDNTEHLTGMLRTSANVVPGDSGGALASTSGKVIGMDTAAATGNNSFGQVGGNSSGNVGFAIPINRALSIANQIIKGQGGANITIGATGFLGVLVPADKASTVANPAEQRTLQLQGEQQGGGTGGLGGNPPPTGQGCITNDLSSGIPAQVAPVSSGALVLGELCGTPAAANGIVPGDVIISVAGKAVTTPASLTGIMANFKPGDKVGVTWVTISGGHQSATLTLLPAPPQ